MIDASLVKKLRDITRSGMMDCKKALINSNGDIDKAIKILREKGISVASKKINRLANEGLIEQYIHPGNRIGVILELNCETDFVAKTKEFKNLAKDIAMHIAATKPEYLSINEIPENIVEIEKQIFKKQSINEGKPIKIIDKVVDGRIKKYFKDICLLEQIFIKDSSKTINQLINEKIVNFGEKIYISRFERYELGEYINKNNINKKKNK